MSSDFGKLPLADDVINAMAKWQSWLRYEKRAAKHTADSYQFDLSNLFNFLVQHRARQVNLTMLAGLTLGDWFRSLLKRQPVETYPTRAERRLVTPGSIRTGLRSVSVNRRA